MLIAYDMLGYTFKGRYNMVLKLLKLKKSRKKIETFDVVCYALFQRARILITNNENLW